MGKSGLEINKVLLGWRTKINKSVPMFVVGTKRVYDPVCNEDGYRILTMRFWPRGIPRTSIDYWEKEFGPSVELLKAGRSDVFNWEEYSRRYIAEMSHRPSELERLYKLSRYRKVTLLCGCKDENFCHRSLLKEILLNIRQVY